MNQLEPTLFTFASLMLSQPDSILEQPWKWGSYETEGIRFGVLRVLEELESLNARIAASAGISETVLLFSATCEAYRDLQALLLRLDIQTSETQAEEGEWDVRTAYAHIVAADMGFYGVAAFTLELHRAGNWSPEAKMTAEVWDRLLEMDESAYESMLQEKLDGLKSIHGSWHNKIAGLFSRITDADLDLPSRYWEAETYPLRFRLGRFASHMRQHTIQIEKTLLSLGENTGEMDMLVRRMLAIYGKGEPFIPDVNPRLLQPLLTLIEDLSAEIGRSGSQI